MVQAAQARSRQAEETLMVAAKPPLILLPIRRAPQIEVGNVLLRGDSVFPPSVQVDLRPAGEWKLVANEKAPALGRRLEREGWNFFFIASMVASAAVGFDSNKALLKALDGVARQVEAMGFNALEIVSIEKQRFFGIHRAKIRAHARHIRNSPFVRNPDPHHYPRGLWEFTRIFTISNRKAPELKVL